MKLLGLVLAAMFACSSQADAQASTAAEPRAKPGLWRAWFDSPGGELPFELELEAGEGGRIDTATILNGSERIPIPVVQSSGGTLTLSMPHYDSKVTAAIAADGAALQGEWVKRGSGDSWTRLPFQAHLPAAPDTWRFAPIEAVEAGAGSFNLTGRWRVQFSSDDEPSVGIIGGTEARTTATFLTTLGDYRFLAGDGWHNSLRLSCFDGAHAFLFKALLQPDGSLKGDFWSRDTWHETWTAVRDENASLPDAFELTRWNDEVPLASLKYPDLDGTERSLGDAAFAGKARILKLFGTWCPNCNDEAGYLAELDRRYRKRGLSILGLAFEHTGEFERDATQVRRYTKLHGIEFPILLAGISDKADASQRFPLVDRVRAYPTTIFIDAKGQVRAIHTGFSGPATGDEHTKLREDFERMIETLLGEAEAGH